MASLTLLQKHTIGPYTNPVEFLHLPSDYFFVLVIFWQSFKAYSGVHNIE